MAPFLRHVIEAQRTRPVFYAEPFAGGAGAAMQLLSDGVVEHVALNDLNGGITSFWRAVFEENDRLAEAVRTAELSLGMWHQQREIQLDAQADPFERGFATFYLNRTNRSGILGGRPIGGLEQTGTWKLDARFNKADLVARIRHLSSFRDRVTVTQNEGRLFLDALDGDRTEKMIYVDPPYLKQGEDLYLANMLYRDHVNLARTLLRLKSPWLLTYDRDDRIPEQFYPGLACAAFSISHTAAIQHLGKEYLVVPEHVRVDVLDGFGPRPGSWLPGRSPAELAHTGRRGVHPGPDRRGRADPWGRRHGTTQEELWPPAQPEPSRL